MANHFRTRNTIYQIRLKQVKKRLKEGQMKIKEKDSLELLADASLDMYTISLMFHRTNFENF